ncbi:asparagine synthase (glutamine-hydrolyzing) [Hyphomicrobium sp. ghe19]|uniref:asparagine synthase (glutamine-hydrolyzing) n=1 Tax=Hyphomicrobium sp. ghe19 TaxID=2682968 RepID=UPI001366E3A8|nr:Asparagine synthetase [glutamine-hydrolyzing] 1 [Hyphomicrobium sp. ghe19]
MCGINGIFAYHYAANLIDREELTRSRDYMAARGPDGKGQWTSDDDRVGFGHRRLSIIDLSEAASQPMISSDGKLVVTFNGEIYNYRELRQELEAKSRTFRSNSDTEILLHLYAEKGNAMVHDLRGMFSFAIWDADKKELFLARDPYGIKPLYYADDGWTFRFASQVKALLEGGKVSRDPEPAGQVGFYLWGSVPEPFTSYRAIRAVPAGATVVVDRIGAHELTRYHSIAAAYREAEEQNAREPRSIDGQAQIREALLDSVKQHLVADVPVGAFLSAGIDSGALVGLMRDAGQSDIQTVTLSFEEFKGHADDEAPLAAEVARTYGTRHTTRVVTEREFQTDLPGILDAMDQPSIDGINTWFVSKAAKELGLKVAVSGLGGDELFGGYPSFREIPVWAARMAIPSRIPLLGRAIRKALFSSGLCRYFNSPKAAGFVEYAGTYPGAYLLRRGLFMPWELEEVLDPETVHSGLRRLRPLMMVETELTPRPKSSFAKVAALEASLYMRNQLLRDTDWASMAHGLEVRVPLVDSVLLRSTASQRMTEPDRGSKMSLARAPRTPLPATVTKRRKTGFTTPIGDWLRRGSGEVEYPSVPSLNDIGCHWSRRWAYGVASAPEAHA